MGAPKPLTQPTKPVVSQAQAIGQKPVIRPNAPSGITVPGGERKVPTSDEKKSRQPQEMKSPFGSPVSLSKPPARPENKGEKEMPSAQDILDAVKDTTQGNPPGKQ